MANHLLARYADATFWLARYTERAESLARILDVHESFARDEQGAQNWRSVVELHADESRFYGRHHEATAATVVHFYILDENNPSAIISCIRAARATARVLRPFISTEMWTHLNVFQNWVNDLGPLDVALPNLTRVCGHIKENCQTHYGITEGTFYRDQGWVFYRLGKAMERADETTRLLDVRYHMLLPRPEDNTPAIDESQWNALLRSVAGYHAYRRTHPRGIRPDHVAGFLLFNEEFPRSLAVNVSSIRGLLDELRGVYGLTGGARAEELINEVAGVLARRKTAKVVGDGLHEFNDWIQRQLIELTNRIAEAFFAATAADRQKEALAQ